MSTTLRDLLAEGRHALDRAGIGTARLDAEVLLMDILQVDRARLYVRSDDPADETTVAAFRRALERRVHGEPVAYITGHKEFMGLDFLVHQDVLVPRPETEYLVESALARLRSRRGRSIVVDVGTGSGAIAVSIAHWLPDPLSAVIVGSDISLHALRLAAINRDHLAPGQVSLVCGDLLSWCGAKIDIVLANLPYLREDQVHAALAWEPRKALFAGADGFSAYRALLVQARSLLRSGGAMIFEIDPSQAQLATEEASRAFPDAEIVVESDLSGWDRYVTIVAP